MVIGTAAAADHNLVGGNGQHGIGIYGGSSANTVQGNTIGGPGSPQNTGNTLEGIQINNGSNNTIGGLNANEGNVISFNRRNGAVVLSGTGNAIVGNSITANSALGIDLQNDGVTGNDAGDSDSGANLLQNFPVLSPTAGGVTGTLNGPPNSTFRVEFFANTACDASGNGEGQTFLGAFSGITTDATGNATIPFRAADQGGPLITATATDPNNNTSEFSSCVAVEAGLSALAVTNTGDSGPGSLRQAILDANATVGTGTRSRSTSRGSARTQSLRSLRSRRSLIR